MTRAKIEKPVDSSESCSNGIYPSNKLTFYWAQLDMISQKLDNLPMFGGKIKTQSSEDYLTKLSQTDFRSIDYSLMLKPIINNQAQQKNLDDFIACHNALRTSEFWQQLEANQDCSKNKKEKLALLKKQWMQHAQFSHCTIEWLLQGAYQVNQSLAEIDSIKQSIVKHFGSGQSDALLSYLTTFTRQLLAYQKTIAEAFAIRINYVLETGDLINYEPLTHLKSTLKKIEIDERLLANDYSYRTTPLPITYAYRYGLEHGCTELKMSLNQLLSNQDTGTELSIVVQGTTCYLVPNVLSDYIFKAPPSPAFFKKDHSFTENFIARKQPFIIQWHLASKQISKYQLNHSSDQKYPEQLIPVIEELESELNYDYTKLLEKACGESQAFIHIWKAWLAAEYKLLNVQSSSEDKICLI